MAAMLRVLWCVLALGAATLTTFEQAAAIDVQCIEASRYKHLWRIFGNDPKKFADYFQIDAKKLPDPELCRAGLVIGSIANGQEVEKLLGFIIQNRGWLATLYLASSGGSVAEGVRLAYLARGFWLKTEAVHTRQVDYQPDFILPQWMVKSLPMAAQPMPAMFEKLASV